MRRGELWIVVPVAFPKPRPAVIMSVDAWNRPIDSAPSPSVSSAERGISLLVAAFG